MTAAAGTDARHEATYADVASAAARRLLWAAAVADWDGSKALARALQDAPSPTWVHRLMMAGCMTSERATQEAISPGSPCALSSCPDCVR